MAIVTSVTTIEEIREYEQVRTPDYALLANLVIRAKGPERAMSQFAEDTQIGASTLSRIINMNIKKPLSIENIIKIFEARAREEDTLLLDSLARANGLFPKDYAERIKSHDDFAARRNEQMNRERLIKNTIIAGVAAAGFPVREVANSPRVFAQKQTALYPTRMGDFVINLRDENNLSNINDWAFYVFSQVMKKDDPDYRKRPVIFHARRIMERISNWFLLDSWQPQILKGLKMSFVFADEEIFDEFREMLGQANVNNEMTLILVDSEEMRVIKEVWIPGNYEQLTNISIFDMPAPFNDSEEFYDEKYYDEGDANDENE